MEVHHPHHSPKNWKEYFGEFLMLFLAVSLGFLVENQREHYIEGIKEEELAYSLFLETKADSSDLVNVINFRIRKENFLNFLYENYKGDVDDPILQKKFQVAKFIGVTANSGIIFEPRQAILKQLESAGMLRYFKDEKLQMNLLNIINEGEIVKTRMQREVDSYQQIILSNYIHYSDLELIRIITKNGNDPRTLIENFDDYIQSDDYYQTKKFNLNANQIEELRRGFEYYRFIISSTRKNQLRVYQKSNAQLLENLRRIYHFN
ncbi:MAG: hypothetical protein RJA76_537 [Bacteroidota bacterium]|jgi:hypothetical protein